MRFRTFLKTGIEVLHLGGQHWESNSWPAEHWKANSGRWRLFTPAIDQFLNTGLEAKVFRSSVDSFVLLLEVADFEAWGEGVAFTGPEGFVRYKHKSRELWSVGRIDWVDVQHLPARKQLRAYERALLESIKNVTRATRRPKDFDAEAFSAALGRQLRAAHVSKLSRAAYAADGA